MSGAPRSVFLIALGDTAEQLHPAVRRYVAGPEQPGEVGVGEGVFEVAGSRFGKWNLLLRPFVGKHLLVSSRETDVPFTVVNRPEAPPKSPALYATRTFRFRDGEQAFTDVLVPATEPHTLRNRLGDSKRVELELRCWVSGDGHLRLSSRRAWLRLGRLAVRLPRLLGVQVDVQDGFDEGTGRQTIVATVRNPIMGTVLEYRGSFVYHYEVAGTERPPVEPRA